MSARQINSKDQTAFDWAGTPRQEREFAQWLAENQRLWRMFVRYTFEAIRAGQRHYSADAVLHRVRWESTVAENGDEFKANNNFTPYLAREFHRRHPRHAGFFRLRRSKADDEIQQAA